MSYINLRNFEVTDKVDEYIDCDFEIAKIIALLNEKGYKTRYSCAGHNQNGFLEKTIKEPISCYDEFMKIYGDYKTIHITKIDDDYFYHKDDVVGTHTYILFDENYDFKSIPNGFCLELFEDITGKSSVSIHKRCDFFLDEKQGIRKEDEDIDNELADTWKSLYEWVLGLDYIKNRER